MQVEQLKVYFYYIIDYFNSWTVVLGGSKYARFGKIFIPIFHAAFSLNHGTIILLLWSKLTVAAKGCTIYIW